MTLYSRLQRLSGTASGRTCVTLYYRVKFAFERAHDRLQTVKISRKKLLSALLATLVVSMAGVALTTWWFRSVPVSYRFGSYAGCPPTYINTGDPSWEKNPHLNMKGGAKTKPFTQAEHVLACSVPIVHTVKEREQFIKSGRLERLQGSHMRLFDVEEPYVNPLLLLFATRLSDQYYSAKEGCGYLDITGALRNLERHREFGNGSPHSLHPYGMGLDLRIPEKAACREWLINTLLKIEHGGRIDFGKEGHPAHFHVSLIPGTYEAWLMNELGIKPAVVGYDVKEVQCLTTALYFEGAINEPEEGLLAIASVIKNRRDAKAWPDSICGVVAEGAHGQKWGGCQFSFKCDGLPEQPWVICEHHREDMKRLWGESYPCGRRWARYHEFAVKFMAAPDNTDKAVQYYTGKPPKWARGKDPIMIAVKQIGSHKFGRSKWVD